MRCDHALGADKVQFLGSTYAFYTLQVEVEPFDEK